MMNEPQVSFITVCYNGFKDTCELIESLQTHVHSVSYEIIVVDNASREDEATRIKELYSDIVTLRVEPRLLRRKQSGNQSSQRSLYLSDKQ